MNTQIGRRLAAALAAGSLALGAWGADIIIDGVKWRYTVTSDVSPTQKNVALGGQKKPAIEEVDSAVHGSESVDASTIPWTFSDSGIDYTVTAIAEEAFHNDSRLNGTLAIPDAVQSVGNTAFSGCANLVRIASLGGATSLGSYAFSSSGNSAFSACACDASTLLTNVTAIGSYAFRNSTNITGAIRFNPSLATIGAFAFCNNANLTGALIPGPGTVSAGTQDYTVISTNSVFGVFNNKMGCEKMRIVLCGRNTQPDGPGSATTGMLYGAPADCKVFVPVGNGASQAWTRQSICGNNNAITIIEYGPGEDLDIDIDTEANLITATVKSEAALTNILAAASFFKSDFKMDTHVDVAGSFVISEGAVTPEMVSGATYNFLIFEVKTQAQLESVLAAVDSAVPVVIDIEGAEEELTIPENRWVAILAKGGWKVGKKRSGLVVVFR